MEIRPLRIFAAAGLAAAVILSGCTRAPAETAEVVSSVSETSAHVSESVSGTEAEVTEETAEQTETEVPENDEPEYVEVSPNNEFIDFDFIEDYQGTTDIGGLANKAVEFLTTTGEYSEAMADFDEIDTEFGEPYIADGKIVPQFEAAYPNDYDGDGKTETFITVAMPFRVDYTVLTRFFIYADSEGNMTLLDHISGVYDTILLNYGGFKQITFGGSGTAGIEDHTNLYGVVNGEVKKLYGIRGEFCKNNCFLSAFGAQGAGAFMYYDTAACEYRAIAGEDIPIDKIKEMDSTDALSEFYEWYDENGFLFAELIGGRYYVFVCGATDMGTAYLYENGGFIQTEDCQYVHDSHYEDLPKVIDIDITKAIAEMKPPKEPFVKVSPGNEFIDYEFIEDYQGTTDIGDLADKAVEFLMTAEEYAESMEHIAEFSGGEFAEYVKDGVIVPKFNTAYPNDYDGDGRTETFIAVNMPVHYNRNTIASFYIYADSAENMTILGVWGKADENVTFLNYGRDKQIAFGCGFSPYGSITYLYGVKYGSPVLLYSEQAGLEKRACFLRSHGFQASEHFMYYDTAAREYRQIAAEKVSHDELNALDTSGSLNSVFEEHGGQFSAWIVGEKYYCIKVMFEFADVYTYDNGTFTPMSAPIAGLSIPISSALCVKDIDIDKAVSEMKKP